MARLIEVGGSPVNRTEREVVARLVSDLPDTWHVIPNVDIHDGRSGHAYECDAIVIGPPGVCIVEIKGWRGTIQSRTHGDWQLDDGKFVANPLKVTDHKARVLASHLKSLHLRHGMRPPYVSACVVVGDPRATFEVFPPDGDRCLRIDTAGSWLTQPANLASPRGRPENYARFVARISDHVIGRLKKREALSRSYGNYRVTGRVGGDDESTVWLARHAHLDDGRVYRVRTWFLSAYLHSDEQLAQRKRLLQRAAEALSRIGDHPNVAQLRDFGEQEGEFYEVTDWSESGTLATARSGGLLGTLELPARVSLTRGLLEGVGAAVAHGVIHRNLQPQAILLDPDGTPRITDYDRAFVDEAQGTVYGALPLGSNPYRPPELETPGLHEATEASDVYSVAAMVLDLLAVDDLPAPFVEALKAAAAKDPTDRRASASELLALLAPPKKTPPRFELKAGARIDGNTIVESLGKGRDGSVFRVRNDLLQADYALKVLDSAPEGADPLAAWRHAKAIRSRHLRSVHWVGVLPDGSDRPYILLELLQGQTLRERLDEKPRPSVDDVLGWADDVLEGLAALHPTTTAPGLVHRDLKPDNVLLTPRGAVVVDLSLAASQELAGARPVGSPRYHPPDLAQSGWGPHADLFALGCIVYEALAGVHPWGDGLPGRGKPPRPLSTAAPGVPLRLGHAVDRAIAASASERFADAESMAEALASGRATAEHREPERTDLGRVAADAADSLWAAGRVQRLVEHDFLSVPLFDAMRACAVPPASDEAPALEEALLGTAARLHALETPLPELAPSLYDTLLAGTAPAPADADDEESIRELRAEPGDAVLVIGGLHPMDWEFVERHAASANLERFVWAPAPDHEQATLDGARRAVGGLPGRVAKPPGAIGSASDYSTSVLAVELPTGDRQGQSLADLLEARRRLLKEALDVLELHDGHRWIVASAGCVYLGHGLRVDVAEGLNRGDEVRARWSESFGVRRNAALSRGPRAALDRPVRERGGHIYAVGRLGWPAAGEIPWLQDGGLSLPECLLPIWFVPRRHLEHA